MVQYFDTDKFTYKIDRKGILISSVVNNQIIEKGLSVGSFLVGIERQPIQFEKFGPDTKPPEREHILRLEEKSIEERKSILDDDKYFITRYFIS